MNDIKRASQFIELIRDHVSVYSELVNQPNFNDVIYGELIRQGVSPEDQTKDVSYLFSEFHDYFLTKRNINAFFDSRNKYFFRLENNYEQVINAGEQIKMYIPLDEEHLEEGVKEIFTFLGENNISHVSKVAKKIRFDDIVVRLSNSEDAKRLNAFVNSNPYIMEGLIKPNPFAFTRNNIAYASDGSESYNSVFANYVELYFKKKAQDVVDGAKNTLSKTASAVGDALSNVKDTIVKPFQQAYDQAKKLWDKISSLGGGGAAGWSGANAAGWNDGSTNNIITTEEHVIIDDEPIVIDNNITLLLDLKNIPAHISTEELIKMLSDKKVLQALTGNPDFQSLDAKVKEKINLRIKRARGI